VPLLYSILFGLKKEAYEPVNNNSTNIFQFNNNMNESVKGNNMPNKYKEQSINMSNKLYNNIERAGGNNNNNVSHNSQPQPWIIE
jgi:hypothetical protein